MLRGGGGAADATVTADAVGDYSGGDIIGSNGDNHDESGESRVGPACWLICIPLYLTRFSLYWSWFHYIITGIDWTY